MNKIVRATYDTFSPTVIAVIITLYCHSRVYFVFFIIIIIIYFFYVRLNSTFSHFFFLVYVLVQRTYKLYVHRRLFRLVGRSAHVVADFLHVQVRIHFLTIYPWGGGAV